jgi:hypothetical protein
LPQELKDLCDVVEDWYQFGARVATRLMGDVTEAFSPAERLLIERATSSDTVYAELSSTLRRMWEERSAGVYAREGAGASK